MAIPPPAVSKSRPLSPHLQIWRWTPTMATSILHRITGVGLALGTLFLALWLVAAASGPDSFAMVQAAARHPLGMVVLIGYTAALVFHLLNGVRHLAWDLGYGFNPLVATRISLVIIAATVLLTVAIWAVAAWRWGLV